MDRRFDYDRDMHRTSGRREGWFDSLRRGFRNAPLVSELAVWGDYGADPRRLRYDEEFPGRFQVRDRGYDRSYRPDFQGGYDRDVRSGSYDRGFLRGSRSYGQDYDRPHPHRWSWGQQGAWGRGYDSGGRPGEWGPTYPDMYRRYGTDFRR